MIWLISYNFFQGFGSVFIWYGSGSSILGWILIRIRIQSGSRVLMTKTEKNLQLKKITFFFQKLQFTYPYASIKDVQVNPALQNKNVTIFFLLLWVIFALLDPDPDPDAEYGSGSTDLIESGSNPAPDPKPWFFPHRTKKIYTYSDNIFVQIDRESTQKISTKLLKQYVDRYNRRRIQIQTHDAIFGIAWSESVENCSGHGTKVTWAPQEPLWGAAMRARRIEPVPLLSAPYYCKNGHCATCPSYPSILRLGLISMLT